MRPNYRDFRKGYQIVLKTGVHLEHSAKGSTWEKHKYINKIDGTYYYPNNYKGGRHLPDRKKETSMEDDLFEKLKSSKGGDLDGKLRGSFDKILKEKLGVDWATLSKEEVDKMQSSLIDRLKAIEKDKKESSGEKVELVVEKDKKESSGEKVELTTNDIENLAKEVIRGNFGNGQTRKDLLGENYAEVQKRVNELMKGSTGQKKVSEATQESVKKVEEAAKKADEAVKKTDPSNVHSGVDMEKVQSVYRNRR